MKHGKIIFLMLLACGFGTIFANAKTGDPGDMKKEAVSGQIPGVPDSTAVEKKEPRPPVFSSDVSVDEETGWHVVTLSVTHPDELRKNISAKISPEGGSTLFSLKVGGIEFLQTPDGLEQLHRGGCGVPIMYPTPNRVRDQRYIFNNRWYTMLLPGEEGKRRLHGFVRDDDAWQFDEPVVTKDGVMLRTRYIINKNNPRFQAFPFPSVLTMEYTMTADRLTVSYTVKNNGGLQLGFGFGLHPFWKVLGGRENIRVQADLPWRMEATEDLLPTGEVIPVNNTIYDVREPKLLTEIMGFDDVYYGSTPASKIRIFYDALHVRLDIKATQEFSHVVLYTPDRDYFCLENQTCSTDAFNLFARGLGQRAGLRTLNPGKTAGGHIEYIFSHTE